LTAGVFGAADGNKMQRPAANRVNATDLLVDVELVVCFPDILD
jgi:hypothetical protein